MDTPGIVIDGVSKVYPDGTKAVHDVSLTVGQGELLVLVGPSGCGKSTTLRMVAGLEEVTEGRIEIGGRRVDQLDPKDRDVAMVFQSYALYPHKTVFQNIAYPLRLRGTPKGEIEGKVQAMAELLGLTELLHKRPGKLSGGQRQRVAMGRALVRRPAAFLLDEPLSNLDAKLRTDMRAEIKRLHGELGVTTLYVTHDQVEAMTMGDRVAVFHKGFLQQVGSPRELYAAPTNTFVATVVGSPSMNLMVGVVRRSADGVVALEIGDATVRLSAEEIRRNGADALAEGRELVVGLRPEAIELGGADSERRLHGVVALVEDLGSELLLHIDLPVRAADVARLHGAEGEDAQQSSRRLRLKAAVNSQPELQSRVDLSLSEAAIFLFDPDSGAALGAEAAILAKETT